MTDYTSWTATETARRIRDREVSVREVTEAHLARLEAVNPRLNAVVEVATDCLDQADRMDASHPGQDAPPLWGVPATTKSNTDQIGFANSNGLPALAGNIATDDSPVNANLKAAGAVILGRTNTPEFSLRWFTSNPLHGTTKNPWNDRLTPGGSSGGASAAVAAGIGSIGLGNDLGGSLRYPAYCCGLVSIRPSQGRIPAFTPSAQAERAPAAAAMSVQGPITRTVEDTRLALSALASRSPHDPDWVNAPDSGRPRREAPRIGYSPALFADTPVPHPAVAEAMEAARAALAARGAEMIERPFDGIDRAAEVWGDLLMTETEITMGDMIRQQTSGGFQKVYAGFLAQARALDLPGYLATMGERTALRRGASRMFDDIDAYLMPVSLLPPVELDMDMGDDATQAALIRAQRPLFIVNVLGLPSVAVPTGLCDGVPMGVQIVGPQFDDMAILDIAAALEAALPPMPRPSLS